MDTNFYTGGFIKDKSVNVKRFFYIITRGDDCNMLTF